MTYRSITFPSKYKKNGKIYMDQTYVKTYNNKDLWIRTGISYYLMF